MRIIFVRHGHPDYKNDCLTPLGHKQAEAAAERLKGEPIEKIYSSPCGRAFETAEHIAKTIGLKVFPLDFMREIGWGSTDGSKLFENGHPWKTVDNMVSEGQPLLNHAWQNQEPFCKNTVVGFNQKVANEFDNLLTSLGFRREGYYYRVINENNSTIVLASHGGSSSVVLSHLFNLPLPFVIQTVRPEFTGITVVTLCGKANELISPRFKLVNDAQHISSLQTENIYDR